MAHCHKNLIELNVLKFFSWCSKIIFALAPTEVLTTKKGKLNSDPVTFENTLPTNYNIIVNSANDYGQIEFSSFAGKTNTIINFGVYSSSTLTEGTTYSSVIEGLGSSNITNTTGTFISGSVRNNWTLANSSGTTWDLVVDDVINIAPDTNTSVINSTKTNVITGINNLLSVTEVNFAHMNTYDCDLFNGKNACLSLGGRHTKISNPTTQIVVLYWWVDIKLTKI